MKPQAKKKPELPLFFSFLQDKLQKIKQGMYFGTFVLIRREVFRVEKTSSKIPYRVTGGRKWKVVLK
jgi:hypothetical protein